MATIEETVTVQIVLDELYPIEWPTNKKEQPTKTIKKRIRFLGSSKE
ncbi:MAG: hypothetical protein Q7K44_04870 [Candidatus Liptonbacteria bacterium]|nr:hypothetical protein [Candidatus Liptonbacteria bacterium]